MGQEDYPYCIACDCKVRLVIARDGAIVYICSECPSTATVVEDNG